MFGWLLDAVRAHDAEIRKYLEKYTIVLNFIIVTSEVDVRDADVLEQLILEELLLLTIEVSIREESALLLELVVLQPMDFKSSRRTTGSHVGFVPSIDR